MRASLYNAFRQPLTTGELPDPPLHQDGVLIAVEACGICRSDWHAWMGHDTDIRLPHVPGHELAGTIDRIGTDVRRWAVGDRVTVPFCCGCGSCQQCLRGAPHICDAYTQPGFTHWGAFADLVAIRHADLNLVALPAEVDAVTAASLGCRFATSFRALVDQGRCQAGQWVAVHGCGGVGLSAIMIARAIGAEVIAIDIDPRRLAMARQFGAAETIDPQASAVVARIRQITGGGADISIDALGSRETCWNSIECLAKRGRHIQVGLMLGDHAAPSVPMSAVIAGELEIYGSHGMQAVEYPRMLRMIASGTLDPRALVRDVVSLEEGARLLTQMDQFPGEGMTVIEFP